jgi:protein-tyrosine phosphatase
MIRKFNQLEIEQRNRLSQHGPDQEAQWMRLTGHHITERNRYINVEPFANNRIKLNVADGENDYINASPIVLGSRHYIATQGPKDSTTLHFYRMLAERTEDDEDPAVVVMLTQTHEAGREKCFPYFPDKPDTPLHLTPEDDDDDGFEGQVHLDAIDQDTTCRCTIRKLRLRFRMSTPEITKEDDTWREKTIFHLLFTGWPDFSVPEGENREAMLNLINLSAHLNREAKTPPPSSENTSHHSPRIVHCSAGVGRSGTFIALDFLLIHLRSGNLDNLPDDRDPIADTVALMRKQRMMMVQSEAQFIFLYEVMRAAWLARSRSRPASPIAGY